MSVVGSQRTQHSSNGPSFLVNFGFMIVGHFFLLLEQNPKFALSWSQMILKLAFLFQNLTQDDNFYNSYW